MQSMVRKYLIIPIRIRGELAAKLDRAVKTLHYPSRNEFIREAVEQHIRDTLESKIIEVRDVSDADASRMIDSYLSKNPGAHYVSELAEKLGLELDVAFRAAKKLLEDGTALVKSQ